MGSVRQVRFASKAAAPKTASKSSSASKSTPAKKVEAAKTVTTKAPISKVAPSPKASTTNPPGAAAAKAPAARAPPPAPRAPTPKTPFSRPATKPAAPTSAATPQKAIPNSLRPSPPTGTPPATPTPAAAASKPAAASPPKPLILEKPEKFNPPSHGARLPRSTPKHHYGAPLTTEEVAKQDAKHYPGLPPPKNSWSHWFLNNKGIHLFITVGTLVSLAIYSFTIKFRATPMYAELIPPFSEFFKQPISYVQTVAAVVRAHEEHESAVVAEKRQRLVDDVAKRNEYRKAHGIEVSQGIETWAGMSRRQGESALADADSAPPAPPPPQQQEQQALAGATVEDQLHMTADGKRKKYFGIF